MHRLTHLRYQFLPPWFSTEKTSEYAILTIIIAESMLASLLTAYTCHYYARIGALRLLTNLCCSLYKSPAYS